jgi:membrane protease YdiL (CAAX protease family)
MSRAYIIFDTFDWQKGNSMNYFKHRFGQGQIPLWIQLCAYYGTIVVILLFSLLIDLHVLPIEKTPGHATLICFIFVVYMEIREYKKYKSQKTERPEE